MRKICTVLFALLILSFFGCESATSATPVLTPTPVISAAPAPTPGPAFRLSPETRKASKVAEGVCYEIFVRAFADGDGDGTGDLKGLTAKLDYLNDGDDATTADLGVTGVWLMPIFKTGSYHGYDVIDYYTVNPDYGTAGDFAAFVAAAHKRGIRVLLDLVLNHTSNQNKKFVDSVNPLSPYRKWYYWAGSGTDTAAKIWGHNLWNNMGGDYYAGLFDKAMPDLNYDCPDVRAEAKAVAKYWLDRGVDGFRLDAAMHLYNAAKTGEPGGEEKCLAWWREFRAYCLSVKPDCYLVGEVWDTDSVRARYMAALGSDFDFALGDAVVTAVKNGRSPGNYLAKLMAGQYAKFAAENPDYVDAPFLSNHDQNRIMGLLGGKADRMKLAAAIYLTLEGLPFVYYGEEIGMMGAKPDEQLRTPMLWGGGDALQSVWIDSKYNKNTVSVSEQTGDEGSVLNQYRRLIRLRTANEALYAGRMTPLDIGLDAVIGWTMTSPHQKAIVLHNLGAESARVTLDTAGYTIAYATTWESYSTIGSTVTLTPMSSAVFVK